VKEGEKDLAKFIFHTYFIGEVKKAWRKAGLELHK
jgi:hypothetical protein